jgi:hypothetical protein
MKESALGKDLPRMLGNYLPKSHSCNEYGSAETAVHHMIIGKTFYPASQ